MAATYDAGSSAQEDATNSPLTWTHTPVGTPTIAVALIYLRNYDTIGSITYGGDAMSAVSSVGATGCFIYYKVTPKSGAQTVSVAYTPNGAAHVIAGCMTFTGTGTNTPADGTYSNDADGDNTLTVSNTTTNDVVVELAGNTGDRTCAPQSSQSEVWDLEAATSGYHGAGYYKQASDTSTSLRVALSGSDTVNHSACRIPGPSVFTTSPSGEITFSSSLAYALNLHPSVAGALTFAGGVTKDIVLGANHIFTGALTFAGGLGENWARTFDGVVTFSGGLVKNWARIFAGALTFGFSGASGTNAVEVLRKIFGKPNPSGQIKSGKRV